MARKKLKSKEPIRIRFKSIKDGNKSIYLDIYHEGRRTYEFLKLYLVPETSLEAKQANANTMQVVNTLKAQRIIELTNGKAGLSNPNEKKVLLCDWLDMLKDTYKTSGKTTAWIKTLKVTLEAYKGNKTRLGDIDKDYCLGFINFLKNEYTSRRDGKKLSDYTIYIRVNNLKVVLNDAVCQCILPRNPFNEIRSSQIPSKPESKRVFLTVDEVKLLEKSEACNKKVKNAFLFSCFSGLRYSDIKNLRWENIVHDGEQTRIEIVMKKTKEPIFLPLSKKALQYMPSEPEYQSSPFVFNLYSTTMLDDTLKEWIQAVNAKSKIKIKKKVSFHVARHTFATMMLTLGADLYTTSKLLGHTSVKTTEIYAKIVNSKKVEAINLIDGRF